MKYRWVWLGEFSFLQQAVLYHCSLYCLMQAPIVNITFICLGGGLSRRQQKASAPHWLTVVFQSLNWLFKAKLRAFCKGHS